MIRGQTPPGNRPHPLGQCPALNIVCNMEPRERNEYALEIWRRTEAAMVEAIKAKEGAQQAERDTKRY